MYNNVYIDRHTNLVHFFSETCLAGHQFSSEVLILFLEFQYRVPHQLIVTLHTHTKQLDKHTHTHTGIGNEICVELTNLQSPERVLQFSLLLQICRIILLQLLQLPFLHLQQHTHTVHIMKYVATQPHT